MYSLMIDRGAPPQDAAKQDGGQKTGRGTPGTDVPRAQVLADVVGELLPEDAGRDALGGSDEPREGNLRRVVHE